MESNNQHIIDITVGTLLQIAERVLAVSNECVIANVWDREGSQETLAAVQNEHLVKRYGPALKEAARTRTSQNAEYIVIVDSIVSKYKIRILPLHPDKNTLFITVEYIIRRDTDNVSEDYWENALDAAGDGMWNVYMPDLRITFSEKWHAIFGYSNDRLNTIDQWMSIIHPDDVESVQQRRIEYFEGKTRYYHSEFRLLCEDGSYKWVLSRGVIVSRTEDGAPLRFTGTHTDIDDRKKTEEKYYDTAQLLALLINNLQEGILVTDENMEIVYANQMFCDIYNIMMPPSRLVGLNVCNATEANKHFYIDPEYYYRTSIAALDKQELLLNQELQMVSGRVLSRDYIPLNLGKGNRGCIWKLRDITAQKNAEGQLAKLRNFYEEILNNMATDIVVFDAQQRYLFINPTAVKDAELRAWMIGKTDEDYCRVRNKPLDLVERRKKVFFKARDEKRLIEWEEMLVNRQGETEYHLRNMYPVFDADGNHLMGIGYGLNITDRVKAQQELKTSMDTFANAFNYSGIGMALISPEGTWVDMNNVLCEMTGYSKEDLMQLTFRDITHPEDLDIDSVLVRKMLRKEINTFSIERRYISRYNKIVQTSLTVSIVWNVDETPKFFIAQVQDITKKKEMDWQIRSKNAELEATKENLLNKINQLEDLSYIIAHNLRGPAGNIKMLAEEAMLARLGGDSSNSTAGNSFTEEEALCLIHDGSSSLLDSLATLMQITEIKLNKEIPRNDCNVAVMFNEICNQLQSTIFEKHAILHRSFEVPIISYPRAYLENILYNLISNALKYTRSGVRPEIYITTRKMNDRVQLIVKDNGLGIDMVRYADKLFRLNEVFHAGFESKGVGLYITKTQVESFGGAIELNSKPNEGCEFIVTL